MAELPSLPAIHNAYLDHQTEALRTRQIPWEGYQRAGTLTSEELDLIKRASQSKSGAREEGRKYGKMYLALLKKMTRMETLAFLLILATDLLGSSAEHAAFFLEQGADDGKVAETLEPLIKLAHAQDDFVKYKAMTLLILLFTAASSSKKEEGIGEDRAKIIHAIFKECGNGIKASLGHLTDQGSRQGPSPSDIADISLQSISLLLQTAAHRQLFITSHCPGLDRKGKGGKTGASGDIISLVFSILNETGPAASAGTNPTAVSQTARDALSFYSPRDTAGQVAAAGVSSPSAQLQYTALMIIWLCSYHPTFASAGQKEYNVIGLTTSLAKVASKDKIARLIIAIWKNVVSLAPRANLPAMANASVLEWIKEQAGKRKWEDDQEVKEDLDWLQEKLEDNLKELTSWDSYIAELETGHLSWTPVHTNDLFWKENATKFGDKDCETLQILCRLLNHSEEKKTLAVAAQDVGQLIKSHPQGKQLVEKVDVKTRVMELMTDKDPDVRFQALMTTQMLVSGSWRS